MFMNKYAVFLICLLQFVSFLYSYLSDLIWFLCTSNFLQLNYVFYILLPPISHSPLQLALSCLQFQTFSQLLLSLSFSSITRVMSFSLQQISLSRLDLSYCHWVSTSSRARKLCQVAGGCVYSGTLIVQTTTCSLRLTLSKIYSQQDIQYSAHF